MDYQTGQQSGLPLPQPTADSNAMPQSSQNQPQLSQATTIDSATLSNTPVLKPVSTEITAQGDALDKEWVSKARAIVEHTKHDPYIQSHELGKMKADYLNVRYNKQIKVGPDKTL